SLRSFLNSIALRHTYAVLAVESGLHSFALQVALGHSRPSTTAPPMIIHSQAPLKKAFYFPSSAQ
ncbi:MAG: hypothetical protein NTX50_09430, partial [Candidatus Sumerlaeota bacterium]|nr:hypothetical protein [Candidatus Sumerlaeota bacterium]